jgi:penicillin-binding protein-related factor A (putative recombinase)
MYNYGKQWETKVKEDWKKLPNSLILRLPDQVTGYKTTSKNPCDFIAFANRQLFMLECKSTHGTTLNFSAMKQYDRLLEYKNKPYIHPGVLLWFNDYNKVVFLPILTLEQIKKDGLKSINIKMLDNKQYNIIVIPAIQKRVFMDCDYKILTEMGE